MKKFIISALTLAPAVALAQNLSGLDSAVRAIGRIIDTAIPIVFGILVIAFFWGLVRFVMAAGDETARKGGKDLMIYSIIALFVAASIWGIVRWIGNIVGVDSTTGIPAPDVTNL